ncbi:MAG: hypothetical protein U0838_01870 [Chloroflexota bacterium]
MDPLESPSPVPGGRGSRKVVGPFTGRQLSVTAGVVLVAAILLFLATRPVATGGSATPTPLPGATPFLVGSPTTGIAIGDQAPELVVKAADGSAAPLLDLGDRP